LEAPRHVVIAGDPRAADFLALVAAVHAQPGPHRALLAITNETERAWWAARSPWMAEMRPENGQATAYVCEEYACQAPVSDPAELRALLFRP
jgi:uncharacterized protein YyaL (SSP411 family)